MLVLQHAQARVLDTHDGHHEAAQGDLPSKVDIQHEICILNAVNCAGRAEYQQAR
jgi:hypothetical protein